MFGPKNTMFILKILILPVYILTQNFQAFSYIPKFYFKILKSGT